MRIHLVTLHPDLLRGPCEASIVGRARRRGLVELSFTDPRRWAEGRHKKVDDRPFGGGPGMVIAAPPMAGALDHLRAQEPAARLLITSPQGRRLDQAWVRELALEPALVVLCGHYEGIDERIDALYRPEPFSLGDFVLSGGEPAALALVDAVVRLLPGALGNAASAVEDSFGDDGELDHPCFTRPREFRGLEVPAALIAGDHAGIARWRAEERRRRTAPRRPSG
ncbi:MAG: tRNA (guanosine(37)-N1)-methyltransferase TrmD [Planctomycetes bacterium]|nr:tRNA (guanosine(37)-N1)-methyltransferase TrmD [Planctomycetota bacterium]